MEKVDINRITYTREQGISRLEVDNMQIIYKNGKMFIGGEEESQRNGNGEDFQQSDIGVVESTTNVTEAVDSKVKDEAPHQQQEQTTETLTPVGIPQQPLQLPIPIPLASPNPAQIEPVQEEKVKEEPKKKKKKKR